MPDALERGVGLDHPGEDPLGDHLDPRGRADAGLQAHAVAHRASRVGLPEQLGHPLGCGPRGQAARLEHEDLPSAQPRLVQERERDQRGLAGAGRRHQHGRARAGERLTQGGKRVANRKVGKGAPGYGITFRGIVRSCAYSSIAYQRFAMRRFSSGACWLSSWFAIGTFTNGLCSPSEKR